MIRYELTKAGTTTKGQIDATTPAYAAVQLLGQQPELRQGLVASDEERMMCELRDAKHIKYKKIDGNFNEVWTLVVFSDRRYKQRQRTIISEVFTTEEAAPATAAPAEAIAAPEAAPAASTTATTEETMTFAQISGILEKAGFIEAAEAAAKLHALNPSAMPVQIGRGLQFPHPQIMNDAIWSATGRYRPNSYAAAMSNARIVRTALCDVRDGVVPVTATSDTPVQPAVDEPTTTGQASEANATLFNGGVIMTTQAQFLKNLRSELREKFGERKFRVCANGNVEVFGTMPNTSSEGWYLLGDTNEAARQLGLNTAEVWNLCAPATTEEAAIAATDTSEEATPVVASHSVTIKPLDRRCKYWAKIIRSGHELPLPSAVSGANDVPCGYARNGDEELFEGDFLLEGEENHHAKNRGWTFWLTTVKNGKLIRGVKYSSDRKAAMKAAGLPAQYLPGSGDIAGLIRMAHALQLGLDIGPVTK